LKVENKIKWKPHESATTSGPGETEGQKTRLHVNIAREDTFEDTNHLAMRQALARTIPRALMGESKIYRIILASDKLGFIYM
jgi:hypothetical protein